MCDSGSFESETKQPLASNQASRWSQNIIEAGPKHRVQSNKRRTNNVEANNRKKEIQRRYRERNRERLKQREAERRRRIRYSNIKRIEFIEEILDADSQGSSGLGGTASFRRNEHTALQKKREYQRIYREKNREVLRQREATRRQRLRDSETITESSTSSNMEFAEMKNEPIIDEISQPEVCQNDVKHLIKEVKKRPALWNMRSPLYYDRELKREGWSEIQAIFAYELLEEQAAALGNSLHKKWKSLRDEFSRSYLQGKECSPEFAEDLDFLKAAIEYKNPTTKLNPNTGLFEEVTLCETESVEEKQKDEEEDNRHFLLSLQGNLSSLPRDFNWKCRFELMQVLSIYNELAAVHKNPGSQSSTHQNKLCAIEQQTTDQNQKVLCVSIRNPEGPSGAPDPQATPMISVENINENRFPANLERRKIWASLLGWNSIRFSKKILHICSDHFDPNDIGIKLDGKKCLRLDANPLPIHSAFQNLEEERAQSSEHTTTTNVSVANGGNKAKPLSEHRRNRRLAQLRRFQKQFPSDVEKRNIWACLLGWSSIRHLKKVFFICSDHFDPKDLVKRTNGTRHLRKDSNPLPQHCAFGNQFDSSSTDSYSDSDSPKNTEDGSSEDSNVSVPDISVTKQGNPDVALYRKCECESGPSSTTTLATTVCVNETRTLELVEATSQNKIENISAARLEKAKNDAIEIETSQICRNDNTDHPVATSQGSSLENANHVHKKRKLEETDLDPLVTTWCQLLAHKLQDMTRPTRESLMHKIDNLVYETVIDAIKQEPMEEALADSSNEGAIFNVADPEKGHIKLTLDEDSIWSQTVKKECDEIEIEEPKFINLKAEPS